MLNLFTDNKILDRSNLKQAADDNFKLYENSRKFSKLVENTVGKGEIARYEQFLLFPQRYQKACFPGASKGVIVWEWVKTLDTSESIVNSSFFKSRLLQCFAAWCAQKNLKANFSMFKKKTSPHYQQDLSFQPYCTSTERAPHATYSVNPFPNCNISDCSKLKEFADNNFKLDENGRNGRKHCGKRRNCSLRAISPFPTVFSKDL